MEDAENKEVEERIVEQLKNCFDPEIPSTSTISV